MFANEMQPPCSTLGRYPARPAADHCLCTLSFLVVMLLSTFSAAAQQGKQYSEDAVKVVFVYNFLRFTQWPDLKGELLKLCVIDPELLYQQAFEKLQSNERVVDVLNVKYYTGTEPQDAFEQCQLVFFAHADPLYVQAVLQEIQGLNILTIGETAGFLEGGGIVRFVKNDQKIRFQINLKALRQSSLRMTSRLLRLADKVIE